MTDLTDKAKRIIREENANQAYENDKGIKDLKKSINGGFLELARLLYENKLNQYHSELGYDSFESYLAQPELGFDRTSIFRLIRIYETLILKYKVPPAELLGTDYTKLDQILPILTDSNLTEWVDKAKELSRSDLQAEIKETRKLPTALIPIGKYSVIYADPPWDIGSMVLDKWESPLEDKYPTMALDELKILPIQDISADDSVCFMWVTLTTLPDGLELLDSWGFKYHICITWDKGNGWSNVGFHRRTELCLVGYKGRITEVIKQEGEYIPTLITESKTTHSTKPQRMYELIEARTIGPKIELFARINRPTWESWGNQLDGHNTRRN